VYCQVDANLELLDEDGMVDVFGYLKKLRGMRKGLVGDVVRETKLISIINSNTCIKAINNN